MLSLLPGLLARSLAHSVTTEWPFQLVPGDLLLLVGLSMSLSCGAAAAAWPVRVTDDCDTKPAKVLNCLYSAAAAAIDEWVSIYPSCPPARLLARHPAAGRAARLKVQSCNKF